MADAHETSAPETLHCHRHPGRETLLRCGECDRPICTSCMAEGAVGVKCRECAGGRPASSSGRRVRVRTPASGATYATVTLIAINAVAFLAELAQGVTVRGIGGSGIVADGALFGPAVADGDWWRLITAAFLHAGLIHIGFNMLLLWWLGGELERYAGTGRFLAVYLSSVLWGSAGALILSPDSLTVGASGGVFGLMGAIVVIQRQRGATLMQSGVGGLLVLNLVITFLLPGISIGGHLGGLAGGAAAAWLLTGFGRQSIAHRRWDAVAGAGIAGLLVGAVVVSLAVV